MKTVNWENGNKGIIGSHPPKNGKISKPNSKIEKNMHVAAKYKNLDVHLRIIDEPSPNVFEASIMYFEPVLAENPDDLSVGDKVSVNRSNICFIFEE